MSVGLTVGMNMSMSKINEIFGQRRSDEWEAAVMPQGRKTCQG
jgi:hypothetical protein